MEIRDVTSNLLEVVNLADEIASDILGGYDPDDLVVKCEAFARLTGEAHGNLFWLLKEVYLSNRSWGSMMCISLSTNLSPSFIVPSFSLGHLVLRPA